VRRFKVKDLLVVPLGNQPFLNVIGECQGPNAPRTDRPCAQNFTPQNIPCKDNSNTRRPCGANSDTKQNCADAATLRPCILADTEGGPCRASADTVCAEDSPKTDCAANAVTSCPQTQPNTSCAPTIPPQDPKATKFRCLYKEPPQQDTTGVCKGGTDTTIPGMPRDPWKGCLAPSQKPCSEDAITRFECAEDSSKTRRACFRNHPNPEERTRYWCDVSANTSRECKGPDTKWKDCGDSPKTDWCDVNTWGRDTPYEPVGALFECPPLSPLALPPEHPAAADALAILSADLREALHLVQERQRERLSGPTTVAEAEKLEQALAGALADVRRTKLRLAKKRAPVKPSKAKKRRT
jgi:hypothetical protein